MLSAAISSVALPCVLAAPAAAAPVSSIAAATDPSALATLTVTGSGHIARPPDRATVAVTLVTNDNSAARALSENNRRFSALNVNVKATGIGSDDIISTSISSYFNARPVNAGATTVGGQLYGYIVTRNVQITVDSLTLTGSVVDAVTAAGATEINGVSYGFRDRRAVERAALAVAVNDAAAQAQTIAAAAHVQIVRILRIGNEPSFPERVPMMAMARMPEAAPTPTTIAPSDLDVNSAVSVTYVIK